MGACALLTYNHVTSTEWITVTGVVQNEFGITITSDIGKATKSGITISWKYDSDIETLSIQCIKKPFILSCSIINGKINDAIEKILDGSNIKLGPMIDL